MVASSDHIVVVGAGIVGLSIGLRLSQRGLRVSIVERGIPGSGASKAALGSLTPYSDHEAAKPTRLLAKKSLERYPSFLDELRDLADLAVDYDSPGLLEIAFGESEAGALNETWTRLTRDGVPADWLSASEVRSMEPAASARASGAILYRDEAIVDVAQLLAACERAAIASGCSILSNTTVRRVIKSDNRVAGVDTSAGTVTCSGVVLSPGTELAGIEGAPNIPMERVRGEVLEARGPVGLIRRPLYSGDGFMTPRRDGRILLGSNYHVHQPGDDEDPTSVSLGTILNCLNANMRIVPELAHLQLARSWKSWRPRTPDGQPAIGSTGTAGLWMAVGFYGLGITLAPSAADAIAGFVCGESPAGLEPFDPARFLESKA
jgi:glycine oxidase